MILSVYTLTYQYVRKNVLTHVTMHILIFILANAELGKLTKFFPSTQWRLVSLRSKCAANSNHIMKINRYNVIRLLFVHHTLIMSKFFICSITYFLLVREGLLYLDVGKLNHFVVRLPVFR